jgi:hypothetical protein
MPGKLYVRILVNFIFSAMPGNQVVHAIGPHSSVSALELQRMPWGAG